MEILASIVLTPIIVYIWSHAFPVLQEAEFDSVNYETLKKRNGWIDWVATLMMFLGLAVPFILYPFIKESNAFWLAGLAVGSMIIFHFIWVCAATRSFGGRRAREFWRFYELRWGIGIAGIKFVYIPIGAFGLLSAVMVWR